MTIRRACSLTALTTAALAAALALTGCAQPGTSSSAPGAPAPSGPGSPAPGPPAPASSAPASSALVERAPSAPAGGPAKPANGATAVTGTVTAGVEANCLLLRTGNVDYLLIMSPSAATGVPKVGDKVTATGTVDTTRVTTCQQGTPLVVKEIRAG